MRPSPFLLAVLASSAIAGSACFEPLQNGGVTIIGDPGKRIGTVCRFRHKSDDSFCASDEASAPTARVRRIASADDALKGPHAAGRVGDYVLENDEIAIVVDQVGSQGSSESGGTIVDAGSTAQRVDAIGQMLTTLGAGMRQPIYDAIRTETAEDGAAVIEVRGHDAREAQLVVVTRYALSPGSRFVRITTSLLNTGDTEIAGIDFGDTVFWGGAVTVARGAAPAADAPNVNDAAVPYVAAVGEGVAYAVLTDGRPFLAKNDASSSSPVFARGVTIAPRAQVGYERLLMVAPRGDTAAIATELFFLGGGTPGGVELHLAWDGKAFLRPGENRIALRRAAGANASPSASPSPFAEPASLWLALPPAGPLAAELAPGRYLAKLDGTAGTSDEIAFEVKPGEVTKAQLAFNPGGLLRAHVLEVEPTALETARAEWANAGARNVTGILQGKPSPAKIQVLDAASGAPVVAPVSLTRRARPDDHADIALPAGRYRVVASRGPEFTIDETTIEIAKGRDTELELGLARVVDTRGYVGCDLHQPAARRLDSAVTLGARLAAAAAEGVECTVTAERSTVVDPAITIDALGLGAHLRAFSGVAIPSDAVVWSGRRPEPQEQALAAFWALLRASHPATPTATAFAPGRADQPGYPRTFVAVPDDEPSKLDGAALVASVEKQRDVVLTNGPFVTVRAAKARQGGIVSLGKERRADLTVHVERAPWVDASELTLLIGGNAAATVPLTGAKKTDRGALVDEVTFSVVLSKTPAPTAKPAPTPTAPTTSVSVTEDTFAVAVVRGAKPLTPVLQGAAAENKPFAMTAPLWIDADGDGRSLGR